MKNPNGYNKSLLVKQRIFDLAAEMFRQKGYDNVSVRDICHTLGISVSRINYHFGGKESLALEIATVLPRLATEEIYRLNNDIDTVDIGVQEISFTMLWLKILLSDFDCMDNYRDLYSQSFVAKFITKSARDLFLRKFSAFDTPVSEQTTIVLANAYSHSIMSLIDEENFVIMRKSPYDSIMAIVNFLFMVMRIPTQSQKELLNEAYDRIKHIGFTVTSFTSIDFYLK